MRHLVTIEFSRPTHTPLWLNVFLIALVSVFSVVALAIAVLS